MSDVPSAKGMEKYPDEPIGYYDGLPCTCLDSCRSACKGQACGCEACNASYQDFLSVE